jgi:hypothetical protein
MTEQELLEHVQASMDQLKADGADVELLTKGVQYRLFLAVNNYIMLGDAIGFGMGWESGSSLTVGIPVSNINHADQEDFSKLRQRLAQLDKSLCKLELLLPDQPGPLSQTEFHIWTLTVQSTRLLELTEQLLIRPGPAGWGTPRDSVLEYLIHKDANGEDV